MIEIKPTIDYEVSYPGCDSDDIMVEQLLFSGMHVLAQCTCPSQGTRFYHTLPIGHTAYFSVSFSADGQDFFCDSEARTWLAQPLRDSILSKKNTTVEVRKRVYQNCQSIIILNCLDDCYGHMLYKLFNAQRHLSEHSEHGLVLLLHRSLLWLVPDGVAEVWWIDTPLRSLNTYLEGIDSFVKNEMERFQQVYLSKAATHIDFATIDINRFTKYSPFSLDGFEKLPYTFTFVCREDRFWLNNSADYFLYLLSIKFKCLNLMRKYFVYKQNMLIDKTKSLIQKHLKEAIFIATGIGNTGRLSSDIQDERVAEHVSTDVERQWCKYYADSHIVIGVHGSGMLIPTAMSAAFINLTPVHKIPHIGEDVIPTQHRLYSFLSRFLDLPASPSLVAKHAVSIVLRYGYHNYKAG